MTSYHNSIFAMGTRFSILLPGIEKNRGEYLFGMITAELNRLESMLSCFLPDSDISIINDNAFDKPITVGTELFEILKQCRNYYELTFGAFDIGIGKINDYWKDKNSEDATDPQEILKLSGIKNIVFDDKNSTVAFTSPFVGIDLGGFGKGYALQKIVEILKNENVRTAFISFGESSVTCLGKHPYGDYWPVGIRNFYDEKNNLHTFKLIDGSVSTSNNLYKKHIINPLNGFPVTRKMSISVKSASPVVAEVLSTSLFVADDKKVGSILKNFSGIEVIKVDYVNNKPEICTLK